MFAAFNKFGIYFLDLWAVNKTKTELIGERWENKWYGKKGMFFKSDFVFPLKKLSNDPSSWSNLNQLENYFYDRILENLQQWFNCRV